MSKGNAVQQLFEKLAYGKPVFDSDRDISATDMMYVNKTGGTCNLSIFLAQRHFDHVMSAVFQKQIITLNKKMLVDQKITIGRVLTPTERCDYETSCACKRLIIKKMLEKKKVDSTSPVFFVLVDKRKLCLRIDKEYITVGDASVRFGISLDEIEEEKRKHSSTAKARPDRGANKRLAGAAVGPDSEAAKLIPLNRESN
ncbi:unnamed protein product [Cylicocyclus nassatus]|uniref:Uncharacterized protein n=1 Tax=Cylicocyclus nassatus TaxID=53992 RepID=A0AA36M156_CYLNA|nr:unnamed protein product [Cylicocyclus nassatus]